MALAREVSVVFPGLPWSVMGGMTVREDHRMCDDFENGDRGRAALLALVGGQVRQQRVTPCASTTLPDAR